MPRWTITVGLGLTALIAALVAPRLAARASIAGSPPPTRAFEVDPVEVDAQISVVEMAVPPAPVVAPTPPVVPPRVIAEVVPLPPLPIAAEPPGAHEMHVTPQPRGLEIPELHAQIAPPPPEPELVPTLPDWEWDGCPACGMG